MVSATKMLSQRVFLWHATKKLAHQDGKFLSGAIASVAAAAWEQEVWNVCQTRGQPGYWLTRRIVKDQSQNLKSPVHQEFAHHGMLALGRGAVSVVAVALGKEVLSVAILAANQAPNVLVQSHQKRSHVTVSVTWLNIKSFHQQQDGKNWIN